MNYFPSFLSIFLIALTTSCGIKSSPNYNVDSAQSQAVVDVINAVNEKNANKYVSNFSDSVEIVVDSVVRLKGRKAVQSNRAYHFKNHPEIKSTIIHLVEIDEKVILHDKVWLDENDKRGQDIVEIFTFEEGKIAKVEVIQSDQLFQN